MPVTRKKIIEEITRIANKLGSDKLSLSEFRSNSEISDWHIWRLFDSWGEAIEEAGLAPHAEKKRIDDNDLFIEMERVFASFGGICTRTKFDRLSKYSADVYKKRFGRWNNVLMAFRDWLAKAERPFPFMPELVLLIEQTDKKQIFPGFNETEKQAVFARWSDMGTRKFGDLISFRGLLHAPRNEVEVIFLFGIVAKEIGFIVESIDSNIFPDCEAKRLINRRKNYWQRVRIEFETESSHFKDHGHSINECDLIVCWHHNWPDCPLEVVELQHVIEGLRSISNGRGSNT